MKIFIVLSFVIFTTGCASAIDRHHSLQAELDMPIDCKHAQKQISQLQKNYVTSGEQFANGVASILPTAAILNLISGEYSSRWKLANGEYNERLIMRIEDIQKECGGDINHFVATAS